MFKFHLSVIVGVNFIFLTLSGLAFAQSTTIDLHDLSSFTNPGKSWQIAGDVEADLNKANTMKASKGTGVLVNIPGRKAPGNDLFTNFEHGDMDLELDFMMAKGSNSGIYLQGLYELQLEDSWGKQKVNAASNGGIYPRWDENRAEGQKGYHGYAPRQNLSRAPGLWQHLKLSFQAARFDQNGKKTENARLLRVELNGVLIHEDVELFGPTRGAIGQEDEVKKALRFQGDHGPVAFRNIRLTRFENPRPEVLNLNYEVYEGNFKNHLEFQEQTPASEGTSFILTSDVNPTSNKFLLRYTGIFSVKEEGTYNFSLQVPGGRGMLKIQDKEAVALHENRGKGSIQLAKGNWPFELLYAKSTDWVTTALGLSVSGTGIREHLLSDKNISAGNAVDPVLVDPHETPLLRSFMEMPKGPRITHAVSVASPRQLHYTYDMDHGTLVQLWRGDFLDATPMWHNRGNGSSRPLGTVQHLLSQPALMLAKLPSAQAAWPVDTIGSAFRPKGYVLETKNQPSFRYHAFGIQVEDIIRVQEDGKGISRELKVQQPGQNIYARLAVASSIEDKGKGMYMVDGKAYYLRLEDGAGAKAVIRSTEAGQELIIPLKDKLRYSILF